MMNESEPYKNRRTLLKEVALTSVLFPLAGCVSSGSETKKHQENPSEDAYESHPITEISPLEFSKEQSHVVGREHQVGESFETEIVVRPNRVGEFQIHLYATEVLFDPPNSVVSEMRIATQTVTFGSQNVSRNEWVTLRIPASIDRVGSYMISALGEHIGIVDIVSSDNPDTAELTVITGR